MTREERADRIAARKARRETGRRQWANLGARVGTAAGEKDRREKTPPTREQKQAELVAALGALDRGRIGKALRALGAEVPCARDFWRWVHTRRIERPEFSEAQRVQSREWLGLRRAAA